MFLTGIKEHSNVLYFIPKYKLLKDLLIMTIGLFQTKIQSKWTLCQTISFTELTLIFFFSSLKKNELL